MLRFSKHGVGFFNRLPSRYERDTFLDQCDRLVGPLEDFTRTQAEKTNWVASQPRGGTLYMEVLNADLMRLLD